MELDLCRRRRRPASLLVRAVLAGAAVLAGWLAVIVLLPPTLGLRTAPDAEGSLVVLRAVPAGDLVEGDVVSVDGRLREVLSTGSGWIDVGLAAPLMTNDVTTLDHVVSTLPVAGLPLSGPEGLAGWLLLGASAASFGAVAPIHRAQGRVSVAG